MLRKINVSCECIVIVKWKKIALKLVNSYLKVNFLYLDSTILITLRKGRRLILKVSKRFRITNYGNADCCGISSAMVRSGMLDRASEKVKEVYLP